MICSNCDQKRPEGIRFCNYCGAPIMVVLLKKRRDLSDFQSARWIWSDIERRRHV